jgi:hypothetical protein
MPNPPPIPASSDAYRSSQYPVDPRTVDLQRQYGPRGDLRQQPYDPRQQQYIGSSIPQTELSYYSNTSYGEPVREHDHPAQSYGSHQYYQEVSCMIPSFVNFITIQAGISETEFTNAISTNFT